MAGSAIATTRAAIVGASGTGKSTLFWAMCLQLAAAGSAVVLFDPHGNHRGATNVTHVQPVRGRVAAGAGPYFDHVQQLAARACEVGGVTLALEEANLCVRKGHQAPPGVGAILHEGRHLPRPDHPRCGVGALLCARRPVELPPEWLSQVEQFYVFRLVVARDLERVASEGFDPARIRALRRGQFFHLDTTRGEPPHFHAHAFTACPHERLHHHA